MHHMLSRFARSGVVLALCAAVACGGDSATEPDDEQGDSDPTVTTTVGVLTITQVETSDRFPPGCSGAGCSEAQSGFKVLIVWLATADGSLPNIISAAADVYVVGSTDDQTEQFAAGLLSGRLFVAFTPPASETNFSLHWPGNPAVSLGM